MTPRRFYLILCLVGLIVPNLGFWPWIIANGLAPRLFVENLFANGVSAFFGLDVIFAAVVLIGFVLIEGGRLRVPRRWMPIAATLLVGVSFGLPLFLYQRQIQLERQPIA